MSIEKRVFSDSFNWDEDTQNRILKISRYGLDNGLRKFADAGPFAQRLAEMKPIPGKTVVQVVALGDEDRFGCNRNFDGFSKKDNVAKHHTFVTNGHVFKNHKNTHPDLAIGEVLDSAHNDDGHRVELLLAADNNKAAGLLDRLEKTGQLAVSMGSMQAYDVCSLCRHRAPTAQAHCGHIKTALGEVTEDGRKIYMQNPDPTFFDISLLDLKPADRLGWTLQKVANSIETSVVGGHQLPALCGLTQESAKLGVLNKLALMEKLIMGIAQKATPMNLTARSKSELVKAAAKIGQEHVLGALHQAGWLLSPSDFGEVILGLAPKTAAAIRTCSMSEIAADPMDLASLDGSHDGPMDLGFSRETHADLEANCKLAHAQVVARVLRNSVQPAMSKVASFEENGLSLMYGYYKLAFAVRHRHDHRLLQSLAAC